MAKYDLKQYRQEQTSFRQIPPDKIIAWIERNFDFKTRKNGAEYRINSPFDGDTGFNFNINPEKANCHSWKGDDWAGPPSPKTGKRNCSFLKFVKLYLGCSYPEALQDVLGGQTDLTGYLRPQNRSAAVEVKEEHAVALPEGAEPLAPATDRMARSVKRWLADRGYTQEDLEKHAIHYNCMDVIWPYFEFEELVYWQSRSRLNKTFRFPDTRIFDTAGTIVGKLAVSKEDFIYGFDQIERASYLILTEAIFDAHTLGEQAGATGGAILGPKQLNKIKFIGPKKGIILAPDNDAAGIKSVITNYGLLHGYGFKVFYSIPPQLEYVIEGEKRYTKDWNEIYQFVAGSDVRTIMDRGITPLSRSGLLKLNAQIHS